MERLQVRGRANEKALRLQDPVDLAQQIGRMSHMLKNLTRINEVDFISIEGDVNAVEGAEIEGANVAARRFRRIHEVESRPGNPVVESFQTIKTAARAATHIQNLYPIPGCGIL